MESSEESDVELDMEGVMENPDVDEPHEMGDVNKKEMTDAEMEQFDEARGNAMATFSEVSVHFGIDCMIKCDLKRNDHLYL